jgi:hypothetical protein
MVTDWQGQIRPVSDRFLIILSDSASKNYSTSSIDLLLNFILSYLGVNMVVYSSRNLRFRKVKNWTATWGF